MARDEARARRKAEEAKILVRSCLKKYEIRQLYKNYFRIEEYADYDEGKFSTKHSSSYLPSLTS